MVVKILTYDFDFLQLDSQFQLSFVSINSAMEFVDRVRKFNCDCVPANECIPLFNLQNNRNDNANTPCSSQQSQQRLGSSINNNGIGTMLPPSSSQNVHNHNNNSGYNVITENVTPSSSQLNQTQQQKLYTGMMLPPPSIQNTFSNSNGLNIITPPSSQFEPCRIDDVNNNHDNKDNGVEVSIGNDKILVDNIISILNDAEFPKLVSLYKIKKMFSFH